MDEFALAIIVRDEYVNAVRDWYIKRKDFINPKLSTIEHDKADTEFSIAEDKLKELAERDMHE